MAGAENRFEDIFPELLQEIRALLLAKSKRDLATQLPELRIVDRCRCGDGFCQSFYFRPRPKGAWGPGHENLDLDAGRGTLILDILDLKIVAVEALQRDELESKLRMMFP
jgi:hypothetical protein